jgi:hypothetical protein
VSWWTWNKWSGYVENKNRGAAQVDSSFDLKDRQRAGQEYSAGVKRDNSVARIKTAIADMIERGIKVTQKAVAALADVCRSTVQVYWAEITGRTRRFIDDHVLKPVRSIAKRVARVMSSEKKTRYPEYTEVSLLEPTDNLIDLDELFRQMKERIEADVERERQTKVEEKARRRQQAALESEARRKKLFRPVIHRKPKLGYSIVHIVYTILRGRLGIAEGEAWRLYRHGY